MAKRTSIGTWAYNVGPYGENPIPFETVLATLQELKFDGLELGGFNGYPNPQNHPTRRRPGPAEGASWRGMAWRSPASRRTCGASICSIRAIPRSMSRASRPIAPSRSIWGSRASGSTRCSRRRCIARPTMTICSTGWWRPGTGASAMPATRASMSPGSSSPASRSTSRRTSSGCWTSCSTTISACSTTPATARWWRWSARGRRASPDILRGGQEELIARLSGRINHIHLIDSDNTCHKNPDGSDETTARTRRSARGVLDFDALVPPLAKEKPGHDWWTVDLCFWPDAWEATAKCKTALDGLVAKYGS